MATEMIEMSGVCAASDIWSVGCTVIELLTCVPPYYDLQPMPALFRIVQDEHPPISDRLSPAMADFLRQCFKKLSSVTKERDRLKNAVDEFKKHKNAEAGGEIVPGALTQESSLANKEDYLKELEKILFDEKEVSTRRHSEIRVPTERLNDEARRIKLLEREGDRLRSEISLLESKVFARWYRAPELLLVQSNTILGWMCGLQLVYMPSSYHADLSCRVTVTLINWKRSSGLLVLLI